MFSPFGVRCSSIHDNRINGGTPAWLPHCQKRNSLSTDVHIDWNSNLNFSLVHYGSTFGKDTAQVFSSYESFVQKVCQFNSQQHPSPLTDGVRLNILLRIMSEPKNLPSVFKYQPTNKIFDKVCMVCQVRAFDLKSCISAFAPSEIPIDAVDESSPYHVTVHEIAFGQALDETVPPPVLCFNISKSDISECSIKDELKENRAKKKRRRIVTEYRTPVVSSPFLGISGFEAFHMHYLSCKGFRLYYTNDEDVQELIRDVIGLEFDKLIDSTTSNTHRIFDEEANEDNEHSIEIRTLVLHQKIQAIGQYMFNSWWPVNLGREYVTKNTPLPPVRSMFCIPSENVSHQRQWNSLLRNVEFEKDNIYSGELTRILHPQQVIISGAEGGTAISRKPYICCMPYRRLHFFADLHVATSDERLSGQWTTAERKGRLYW